MPSPNNARKPKVGILLVAGASEGGGGTGRRFARIFQHFQQSESASEVWLITNSGFLEQMKRASIVIDPTSNVLEFPDDLYSDAATPVARLKFYRGYSTRLNDLLRREQFDLVHIPLPHLAYSAFLLREDDELRQVFSMTATVGSFRAMNWKVHVLYRLGFASSEAIDTLNSSVSDAFPAYRKKFHVAPCSFTDYSRYQPAEEKRNYIVFAARLESDKNPLLFVDAIGICAEHLRGENWKCFLYGGGELKAQVKARVGELELDDLIELGLAADLSPLLGESRIFVSIQRTENYPSQVLLEAMASENAVIATDVGETRKLVDEDIGLLFGEQSTGPAKEQAKVQLADAIIRLTRDGEKLGALGRTARTRCLGGFNVEVFAEYLENVWLEVLRRHPHHRRPSVSSIARAILGSLFDELVQLLKGGSKNGSGTNPAE